MGFISSINNIFLAPDYLYDVYSYFEAPPLWEKSLIFVLYGFYLPVCGLSIVTTVAIYVAFIYSFHKGEHLFLSELNGLKQVQSTWKYRQLWAEVQKLNSCRTEFDSVMSVFPMFTLAYLFMGTAGNFVTLRDMSYIEKIEFFLDDGILYTANVASILVLVVVIEYYKMKTQKHVAMTKLTLTLVDTGESMYKFALIKEIEALSAFEYTIWSMCKLNREFILGYSSSLLTFTVMLVQLAT
ncbi:hypothetical protein HDE_01628 [Halotydeus destructor]|nr:hypothetical protein HDE_01628 [Halotydeus destructor]